LQAFTVTILYQPMSAKNCQALLQSSLGLLHCYVQEILDPPHGVEIRGTWPALTALLMEYVTQLSVFQWIPQDAYSSLHPATKSR
jgi:hypothetical protein